MSAAATHRLLQRALSLAIAAAGGGVAVWLGLPVAWLLGPVVAVSLASVAGLDTSLPPGLRTVAFFVLGIQAGSGVTPTVVEQIALWPISFVIQMLGVLAVVIVTHGFLTRVLGWDRETALFSSLPGALSFVLAAASETRADLTRIAVVQSVRLLFLIGALVPVLAWLESGPVGSAARGADGTIGDYALLFGVCAITALLVHRARLPGGMMLGALIGSAVLHGGEWTSVAIPPALAVPSLILLGALIGSRLQGIHRGAMLKLLPAAIGSVVIGLAISAVAGLVAVLSLGIDFGRVALAYAPGALEALTVLAFQFDVDPAYVAAHHVVRFISIALIVPLLAKRISRRSGAVRPAAEGATASGVDGGKDRG